MPEALAAVAGNGQGDVWAVGEHGLIEHFDGTRWARQRSGTAHSLLGVAPLPGGGAIAVGEWGTILRHAPP
jgi:hypothetical protein